MIFHGLTETRNIKTGDGNTHRQRRFYCHFHGWFDLFVFPDAETRHAKCNQIEQPAAVGLELPKAMGAAAAVPCRMINICLY